MSLLQAWRQTLAADPDAIALIDATGCAWTRRELDAFAATTARRLPSIARGRRVAFALPNGPAWLATLLALLAHECVAVPLDGAEPLAVQRLLATAVGAALLLNEGNWETLPESSARGVKSRSGTVLLKLTSGSTGAPRGLPFSPASLLADARQICAGMQIGPTDRNLAVIPFGHSYGLGNLVLPLLAQGTSLVCVDTPLPHALAAVVARHRPTVFPAVPALLRALAEADLPGDAFASLRTVISAGAPLPAGIAREFYARFQLLPHAFYGSSETGGISYDRDGAATLAGRSVGTALPGVSVVPIRGKRVRVLSTAAYRPAGYSPCDRVEIDPSGELRLLGRSGRMLKVSGRRLDLAELENRLRALPGIADAFAAPHPESAEHLAAVFATELAPAALRALLREHLAPWKIPRRIVAVPAFPLTARGKTDTAALRTRLQTSRK